MTERTLTERELNRAVLARQLLLERAPIALPRALERVGGLQAQYAPSMYIGLWSRVEGFQRDALTRALERRSVVQATLMRATIHLVARRDYWPLELAIRDARRAGWMRGHRDGPSAREMAAAARMLRPRLRDGPLSRAEIEDLLGAARARTVGMWLDLVRAPPSGTWERRRADLYAAAEDWLRAPDVTPEQALDHVVRRYLGAFGPATRGDIAGWAGLTIGDLAPALERLRPRRFRSQDGDELFDVARGALPDPDTPAPVRLLPTFDAALLAHARRANVLPEGHRARVFNTRMPQSTPTFLVDGAVAGAWRYDQGRVVVDPFERLDRATLRALREEGERMAAFHA